MKKLVTLILSALFCVSMMTAVPLPEPIADVYDLIPVVTDNPSEPAESEEPICAMYEMPDHISGED